MLFRQSSARDKTTVTITAWSREAAAFALFRVETSIPS